jgi:hypothetical protein
MLYRPAYRDLLKLREAFVLTHKYQNCRRVISPSYYLLFGNTCSAAGEMGWIDKDRVREV